jgi:S1-C subfamily serine protease
MARISQLGGNHATNVTTGIHRYLSFGLVLISLALFTSQGAANEQIYQKLLPSAAFVEVNYGNNQAGWGSGVLVDVQRKWVLTAYHVVHQSSHVHVLFPTKEKGKLVTSKQAIWPQPIWEEFAISCKVVIEDAARDLAILELAKLPPDAKAVPLAADSPLPGQMLHVIGNPGTEPALWLYSFGKVRQVYHKMIIGRAPTGFRMHLDCEMIASTIPTNPGDSGGPVVNDNGELVGLVSGSLPFSNDMSFQIDITEIRTVLVKAGKISQAKKF